MLMITILVMVFQSPLVIVIKGDEKNYYQSVRRSDAITEKDVQGFIQNFLEQMFHWEKLSPEVILQQISPLATSGLSDRIHQELVQRAEKDFKEKNISESITNVHIEVTEKNVVATFDKVLRIDGMPLVLPTELAFTIVRGNQTKWNPMGLYVNGLVEHEGLKN